MTESSPPISEGPPTLSLGRPIVLPVALIILAFIAFASVLALNSDGVYHDDDLQHFQMARWAWHDPRFLLNLWGRPGCTVPYALIADIGTDQDAFMLCRFLTISFAAASAIFTALCARRIGLRHPELGAACLLFMPLYFHLSYTTLTEIVCGLYLISGTWLLLSNRCILGAVVLGLAPLARQESVALLAIVAVMFLYRRQWLACVLLVWGLAAWQILSMAFIFDTPLGSYLRPKPTDIYGSGGPFHFILMWGEAIGPSFVGLCIGGAMVLMVDRLYGNRDAVRYYAGWPGSRSSEPPESSPDGSDSLKKRTPNGIPGARGTHSFRMPTGPDLYALLIPIGSIGLVALHTVIFMRGLFAGGGYARFLLPACPWMALCVTAALEWLWETGMKKDDSMPRVREVTSRLVPMLLLLGIGLVNLGLRLNALQPNGSMAWRWPHWQLMIAWKIGYAMILPAVALALWRHRVAVYVVMALIAVDAAGNLALAAQPHRLAQTQMVLEEGIDDAISDAKASSGNPANPPNPANSGGTKIVGFSPWINYFRSYKDPTYAPPSTLDATADEQWRHGPTGMIFVYDSSLTPPKITLDELLESGEEMHSLDLQNPKHAPDPFVVVLRKR